MPATSVPTPSVTFSACLARAHTLTHTHTRIHAQVVLHAGAVWRPRLLPRLLLAISPWLTCHTHNVRTFAQLVIYALMERYPPTDPVWEHGSGQSVGRSGRQ